MAGDAPTDDLGHTPRAYQEEIFRQGQEKNVIAVAPTGSGKTLIAAMLTKWVHARTIDHKKVIFLVPTVSLVSQHCATLRTQTPLKIEGYVGDMGVNSWNESKWHGEFHKADVLVMTAQIFKDILTHAYWKIHWVSLIVFDECHHTQNRHPYNMIMQDHYHSRSLPPEHRPKIFGMTPSPVWNPRNPEQAMLTLEQNLCATIICVRLHEAELSQNARKPAEVLLKYASSPLTYPDYGASLWQQFQSMPMKTLLDYHAEALQARYASTMQSLGPLGADFFLYKFLQWKLQALVKAEHGHFIKNSLKPQSTTAINSGFSLATAASDLKALLESFESEKLRTDIIPQSWVSPKLAAIANSLAKSRLDGVFQAMIFVEQRQTAIALAWCLPRLQPTKDWLRCASLVGHGESDTNRDIGIKGMTDKDQDEVVKLFKARQLNVLIATSVAEEGLDFPACNLVIRFDPLRNIVAYIQSRGRARSAGSSYVIMVREDDQQEIEKYQKLIATEANLSTTYKGWTKSDTQLDEDDTDDNPNDLAEREEYRVQSTEATLTYSSSVTLLNFICALIPRDEFTELHQPKYEGDFQVQVSLPSALPLDAADLVYEGPPKRTKREARRAAAFNAVRNLHKLGVLDDHLSPIKATTGDFIEDPDGGPIPPVADVPEYVDVLVPDPWFIGVELWQHNISISGRECAGLVTSTQLPSVKVISQAENIHVSCSTQLNLDPDLAADKIDLMRKFTTINLWWCTTGTPLLHPLTCFVIPLDPLTGQPDWNVMEICIKYPMGSQLWHEVPSDRCEGLMVMNKKQFGQPLLLNGTRHDRSPSSLLSDDNFSCAEEGCTTYGSHFLHRWGEALNPDDTIVEVQALPRNRSGRYAPSESGPVAVQKSTTSRPFLLPQKICKWACISPKLHTVFRALPVLCRRLTDIYRIQKARNGLKLPAIDNDRLVEALTLPTANTTFNNQRLETLGDGMLKLCVVIYLYNRFPTKHEGQLDILKRNSIANRVLLARAREVGLEHYISSEGASVKAWRYVSEFTVETEENGPCVRRRIARRNLQDCMEALLGASYLTGGLDMALQTGTALGLCVGGSMPWMSRYETPAAVPVASLFYALQDDLGYHFRNGNLLVEAVTHPSLEGSPTPSYQRLEFLGDALVEVVVISYLFQKYPSANSGQLSWARSRAICASSFTAVAIKRLGLHRYILSNNVELSKAIAEEVESMAHVSYEDAIHNDWKYDPPKAVSDVFESVVGAVFVDSGHNFEIVSKIVENVMKEVLECLHPNIPKDPVSRLLVYTAKGGCRKAKFRKCQSNPSDNGINDSYALDVHSTEVVSPTLAANLSRAKGLVAERALSILDNVDSPHYLKRLCDCGDRIPLPPLTVEEEDANVNDETEEGFAQAGQVCLREVSPDHDCTVGDVDAEDEELQEEIDVEKMLLHCLHDTGSYTAGSYTGTDQHFHTLPVEHFCHVDDSTQQAPMEVDAP